MPDPLKFKVAPHIVQDLGINLYTSLPRALAEFVANTYDADSPSAEIEIDFDAIHKARAALKKDWDREQEAQKKKDEQHQGKKVAKAAEPPDKVTEALGERTLPEGLTIVVRDYGEGMSRQDFQEKFLVAGRRRRETDHKAHTDGGRAVMGRKGLGKLAGFGIARRLVIVSRKKGEAHATKITLDFGEIIKKSDTNEVEIPDETLPNGGGIKPHGTTVTLSGLVYEPMKAESDAVEHTVGDHFRLVDEKDFKISLNKKPVKPTPRAFVFAWPDPKKPPDKLVAHEYTTEDGRQVSFLYRLRFTGEGESLPARQRGVRVYAHHRLSSAPDLLDVVTGMHGFRNTDYLDGIVQADVIDEQPSDYIATDRQALRWETPLLAPMRAFLSNEMKTACVEYQKKRDAEAEKKAKKDVYTKKEIEKANLGGKAKKFAYQMAAKLASICQDGTSGDEYHTRLPIFLQGLSQGDVLKAISDLAAQEHPDFGALLKQLVELTHREFGDFIKYVRGRLDGITALKKICDGVDFKKGNNEKELHQLFEKAPWLIDPMFVQFLVSNKRVQTMFDRLAKHLEIGDYAKLKGKGADVDRADLVFLLGNTALRKLVIVELKAPNVALTNKDLSQLERYMRKAEEFLDSKNSPCDVSGYLIGTIEAKSKSEGPKALEYRIKKDMKTATWRVYDVLEVLENTQVAHKELEEIQARWQEEQDAQESKESEAA